MSDLGVIPPERRNGVEPFHDGDRLLGFDLLGFWRWSYSGLVSNTTRGVLAEYLVARAIGVTSEVRDPWAVYDLLDPRRISIEVKSAAYVQAWQQSRHSAITFACPKTLGWDAQTGMPDTVKSRHAKVYVFALLAHMDQATLDPLNVAHWEFYVVPTAVLDQRRRSQHSITLKSLRALHGDPVAWADLSGAVEAAALKHMEMVAAET